MNTKQALGVLSGRIREIALIALSVVILSGVATLLIPRTYTARLTLYVSAQAGNDASTAYQAGLLSQGRVTSYVELLNSSLIGGIVGQKLGLPLSAQRVSSQISASSSAQSVIIDVDATDRSPQEALAIASTIGQVFPDLVAGLERPQGTQSTPSVIVRSVEPPQLPTESNAPSLGIVVGVAAFVGLFVACLGYLALDYLDNTVRDMLGLEKASGAPALAAIPELAYRSDQQGTLQAGVEAYKKLRTNLHYISVSRQVNVLVISSANAGEGKSTTALNLAKVAGEAGMKVLLIDADLRRPTVASRLCLESRVGLSSVLAGQLGHGQAIQEAHGGTLQILTSGPIPPNPSELLGSDKMRVLLSEARTIYDLILIDSPPILPVTDASALAPLCDGVLLVGKRRITKEADIAGAASSIRAVSGYLAGCVLNFATSTLHENNSYYGATEQAPLAAHEKVERVAGTAPIHENGARPKRVGSPPRPTPRRRAAP